MPADPSPALDAAGLAAVENPAWLFARCKVFVEHQSEGEWGETIVNRDATALFEMIAGILTEQRDHYLTATGLASRAEVVEDEATVDRVARAMWAEVEEPTWDEWEAYVTAHPNWRRNDDLPRYKRQARAALRALAPPADPPREAADVSSASVDADTASSAKSAHVDKVPPRQDEERESGMEVGRE